MSDDKKSSNSTNENGKVFNGELFVNNNSNDMDFDVNNNSLRKSTSNSFGGSLSNNIRGSMKSNQSNGERCLTNSLMQDLRGSSKKFSDKKIEFDKLKLNCQQYQANNTEISNNSNSNNNEEDILANIKLPKNDNNNQIKPIDDYDLYEDVENLDNEDNQYEMEEIETNNIINTDKGEEMNEIININQLAKLNEFFNKNKKNLRKNTGIKGNELDENFSLRSSYGSVCNSSHSNNSNGNFSMNLNMRSSKIFNKKEKNSPEKQMENNSNGNLVNLDEGNLNNENDINQNTSEDNNIINEINDNSENKKEDKENKEVKENNKDKERKEMLAKIKDKNNEQNFISKKPLNFENKNINNNGVEDKVELEMQLFNFESFLPKQEKEQEQEQEQTQSANENIENDIIKNYQNIIQNFENSKPNEMLNVNENKEEEKIVENEIKEEDNKIEIPKEKENEKIIVKEMEKEEYVFEKFGKLGWECEKCNNFNFESRTICNRCEAPKQPKSLEQIKLENELKSGERKKKPLIERKGDWQCPLCHNLNFAFRVSCNRCKLPKEMYLNFTMKQQKMNENMNNNINKINLQNNYMPQIPTTQIINNNAPQIIQNQFNIIQCGYLPMYNPYFPQNHFNQIPQPNTNNINNYKRKYKFHKQ